MRVVPASLSIAIALVGCNQSHIPSIAPPTALQRAEFSRNTGLTLPASATAMGWHEERGLDDALWLQVKMPANDLPKFLESPPLRGIELSPNSPYFVSGFQMFVATPPTHYRAGQQPLPNAKYLTVLIDESATSEVIIYLMWNET